VIKKVNAWLLGVLIIAITIRFIGIRENVYFGFDEARDAYVSQNIYLSRDLKLIGPPAGSGAGIFHGPLYWYLVGPIYLAFKGSPEMVSGAFRLINSLAIFPVFYITGALFSPVVGILSAVLFSFSFEQSQYASYVGNPTLALYAILAIFGGMAMLIMKRIEPGKALLLMSAGAAVATQLNLMYVYLFFVVIGMMIVFRRYFKLNVRQILTAMAVTVVTLSTYILAEIRSDFSRVKQMLSLYRSGYSEAEPILQRVTAYLEKCVWMIRDNMFGLTSDNRILFTIFLVIIVMVIIKGRRDERYKLLAIWSLSWVFLLPLGVHRGYYATLGLSVGLIMAVSAMIVEIKEKLLMSILIAVIILSNMVAIGRQNGKSLILSLKPQPMMRLIDEREIIEKMYTEAEGRGFTVRMVSIPYKVQTVWAYLLSFYGKRKYGYLPYWEYGNVDEFPGRLPVPVKGTSCLRFLVVEPKRGLPEELIQSAMIEENYFSKVVNKESIGEFYFEERAAKASDCHDDLAP